MEQTNTNLFELSIDETSNGYLAETAKWAKFLSIVGFVVCGLMIILGLLMGTIMGGIMGSAGMPFGNTAIFSVIYIAIAALYFMPCLYLFKFSKSMQMALKAGDSAQLREGLKNLKSSFKFLGMLTVIILALYAVAFVAGGIFAAFAN